jgi:type IV secretory pathway TrbF-like protein
MKPKNNNPYLNTHVAQREWNDRYMNMAKAIRNWQLAFLLSMIVALGLLLHTMHLGNNSHIQPLAIETCQGIPKNILPLTSKFPSNDRLISFTLTQFIINARTIIADSNAQKILLDKVYAYSADKTITFLHDYYRANNPFNLSAQYTTQINIIHVVPISKQTWQVTWDETQSRGSSNENSTRYLATLTYHFGKVNARFMQDNPFGIYVTALSWSQIPSK